MPTAKSATLRTAAFAVLLAATAMPAPAQESGRYTMEPAEGGYVRLDTRTGEMSFCESRDGQLVCEMAADERRAFEEALDSLSERVAALETAIGKRGTTGELPSEEEFDRTMGMMEKFIRRFFAIVEDLNRDFSEPETGGEPVPERT
jgi:hypothetical protein